MDNFDYADLFNMEAQEYLQNLNQCLLILETNPADAENVAEMFRIIHSLKGMAGTMGYQNLTRLTHDLEYFLEQLKSGRLSNSGELVDLLFEAADLLQRLVENPAEPGESELADTEKLMEKINIYRSRAAAGDDAKNTAVRMQLGEMEKEILRSSRQKGKRSYLVEVKLREGTLMKSVRAYMAMRVLERSGEVVATAPSLQDLEEEKFDDSFAVVLSSGSLDRKELRQQLLAITDIAEVTVNEWPGEDEETMESAVPGTLPERQAARAAGPGKDTTVRVETAKLDELLNLAAEMIITRTRVVELGRHCSIELDQALETLEHITTDLQNVSMKLRMVPLRQVFERFPRMMRDISREIGKEVVFKIGGEDTELDRAIINQLFDPLVHLLRNAVDHGIEPAEQRLAMGKDPKGSVQLTAQHEGSHVVISVEDDGKGLDPAKIRQRALEKGIIDHDEASRLKDDEALQLIFKSGFSTAERLTEISGRGVGMEVVKNRIEALNGSVEIKSTPGQGSRFILRLPLTLAIMTAMLVKTAGQTFAIPVEVVRENIKLQREEIKQLQKSRVISLREEVIPIYSLAELFGFHATVSIAAEQPAVIVDLGGQVVGLVVDELLGQQEVVIKSLGHSLKGLRGIAGATILGDGRVILIVDVFSLLEDRGVDYVKNRISN